ncbi:hypothetical protein RND71_020557 [Anisodus tanguticus]|uniref:Uncharacterized protein n=1 Tax=Anisodus tanguticus TaxID=243964 RepID=A0AAE1S1F1_9SOLA|nr:hypothetical protein RND71_020557 [Anisodus tanguticus]
MNPIRICPRSLSQLSSPTNFHKITHIASTQLQHHRQARNYSSDDKPPEFPAVPQPDKPSESSEVPSAPNFDHNPTPAATRNPALKDDLYGSGAAIPQQGSKSKVRQPHGAEVKIPTPPESGYT